MATLSLRPVRFVYSEYGDAGLYETIVNNSTGVIDGDLGVSRTMDIRLAGLTQRSSPTSPWPLRLPLAL